MKGTVMTEVSGLVLQVEKVLENPEAKAELVILTSREGGFEQSELDVCISKWLRKLRLES